MSSRSPAQTQTNASFTPVQSGLLQRQCASCGQHTIAGQDCAECKKKQMPLQRQATTAAVVPEVPAMVHEVVRSPGQSLDPATQALMESRLGHDLSQVRVHTDAKAAASARAVNALAYTVNHNIVFASGHYAPYSRAGQRLLTHELVHVLQQRQAGASMQTQLQVGATQDQAEREADQIADQMDVGEQFHPLTLTQSPAMIRRIPDEATPEAAPADVPTPSEGPQQIGEIRLAQLPKETRGEDQVIPYVLRSLVHCPCRNVPDTQTGIFYNPELNNLAIAYRHCRGGTTVDIYSQLQSNAQAFLSGSAPPAGTARIGIDINVVGRNVSGRVVLEAVATNESSEGIGGRAQAVFEGGRWRVYVSADYLHQLGGSAGDQLDLVLGGQLGSVQAQLFATDILSGRPTVGGALCIPIAGADQIADQSVNLCPFIQADTGTGGVTSGLRLDLPFGRPEVRREECFNCYCPPPARRYQCIDFTLDREEEVERQIETFPANEFRYYFQLDRVTAATDPTLAADSNTNMSTMAAQVQAGGVVELIRAYASPEQAERRTEQYNQDLSERRAVRLGEIVRQQVGPAVPLPTPYGGGELLGRRPTASPSSRLGDVITRAGFRSAEDVSVLLTGDEIPTAELAAQFLSLFNDPDLQEPADRLAVFGLTPSDPIATDVLARIDQFVRSGGRGYRPWERIFRLLRVGIVRVRRRELITRRETVRHQGTTEEVRGDRCQEQADRAERLTPGFGPIDPSALRPSADSEQSREECETDLSSQDSQNGCNYRPPQRSGRRPGAPEVAPRRLD